MNHISDLFGITRYLGTNSRPMDERASLIAFFVDKLGKTPKVLGIRLSHYSLDELYALKSAYLDRLTRNGKETADKYFWYISRTNSV